MDITFLCENTSGHVGCVAEWGFSAYISFEGTRVLFDTGFSDIWIRNAQTLDIDLQLVDHIVFSHFHSDHTRGIQFHNFKTKKQIILHPDVLRKIPTQELFKIKKDFTFHITKQPFLFAENSFYLGQIPRITPFEKGELPEDKLLDDSALAFKTNKGAVVISGCSHAGICNICEYAKKITNSPLYAVVGGFHLFENDSKTIEGTIDYFKKEKPTHLLPMHCVDFPTLTKFHQIFSCKKYSSGDSITLY